MPSEQSFGIIPIHQTPDGRRYLLVRHRKGHWGFPKGKAEAGESAMAAALRELAEETGIARVRVVEEPAFVERYTYERGPNKPVGKTVTYFVGYVDDERVTIRPNELSDFAWGDRAETRARLTYDEARDLLDRVESHLKK